MRNKSIAYVVAGLAGLVVLGSIGFAVWDSYKSRGKVSAYKQVVEEQKRGLAAAKEAARAKVRAELRKRNAEFAKEEGADAARQRQEESEKRRRAVRKRLFGSANSRNFPANYAKLSEMPVDDPSAEDQEIIDLAGESASETDLDTAAEVAEAALKSQDPRARLAAVEMLSALGEVGLLDIGEFLTDAHPEVANFAAERWELGVQDIVNEEERTALVKVGLLAVKDEDQLRSMVGALLLTTDERMVIQTVMDVIRDGEKVQREAVKDAYENVTGEKWKGEKAAEKWLKENYTPPEPETETMESSEGDGDRSSDVEAKAGI